jgi:hypothetical protein
MAAWLVVPHDVHGEREPVSKPGFTTTLPPVAAAASSGDLSFALCANGPEPELMPEHPDTMASIRPAATSRSRKSDLRKERWIR